VFEAFEHSFKGFEAEFESFERKFGAFELTFLSTVKVRGHIGKVFFTTPLSLSFSTPIHKQSGCGMI
jgi:predicted adenine nucleotide alpha hydrolase (AANH) superfamily ATPase